MAMAERNWAWSRDDVREMTCHSTDLAVTSVQAGVVAGTGNRARRAAVRFMYTLSARNRPVS